jgi:hypothetical protein
MKRLLQTIAAGAALVLPSIALAERFHQLSVSPFAEATNLNSPLARQMIESSSLKPLPNRLLKNGAG